MENVEKRLLWEEIGEAALVPYEMRVVMANRRRETATVHGALLALKDREGQVLYAAPVPNDMDGEEACGHIMKIRIFD